MNVSRIQKVIATVAYADIFDYPLTREEVTYWAVGGLQTVPSVIRQLETKQHFGKEYWYLPGRARIISYREKRKMVATRKWHHIYHTMKYFRLIPTLLLVGVTGGLAVNNAREEDDIDVFFITRKNTLWFTRSMVTLVAEWLGVRRRPGETQVSDKICLNMFMAEDALGLPRTEQDLFAAHEVLQMVPLWERESGMYHAFLTANRWVKYFLPNAWREAVNKKQKTANRKSGSALFTLCWLLIAALESIARFIQLRYMHNRRTNEVIRSGVIRFHPRDARHWVREKLEKILKLQHIPLDKIFYRR